MISLSKLYGYTTNAFRNDGRGDLGGEEMARSTVDELRAEVSSLSIRMQNHERECAERMTYIKERLDESVSARREMRTELRDEMRSGFQDNRHQNNKLVWLMLVTLLSAVGALLSRYALH